MKPPQEPRAQMPTDEAVTFTLNGWGRFLGLVGIPGAISLYLVWWLTERLGTKLDRMIQLLEQIARTLNV
jgi:hypothetical protein